MVYQRYRVRTPHKTFDDPGPDLLRTRSNARQRVKAIMADRHGGWSLVQVREDNTRKDQSKEMSKADALDAFGRWAQVPTPGLLLLHSGEPAVVVMWEAVAEIPTASSSPDTVLTRSLIEHQFPRIRYAGGYVYRTVKDSASWSDHAWGTAIDETENPPDPTNDETLDWLSRMGKARCLDFDYALGSRDGEVVVAAAPDYDVEPSTAADSHLWHNHISIVDHDGRKPPKEGGAW